MFGLGHIEVIMVLAICVLVFGFPKIPELGRGLWRGIRHMRDGLRDDDSDPRKEISNLLTAKQTEKMTSHKLRDGKEQEIY